MYTIAVCGIMHLCKAGGLFDFFNLSSDPFEYYMFNFASSLLAPKVRRPLLLTYTQPVKYLVEYFQLDLVELLEQGSVPLS